MKVKSDTAGWSRRYKAALRKHLAQGPGASLNPAFRLGREALALKLTTLEIALIHGPAVMTLASRGESSLIRRNMAKRAKVFFSETIVPIESSHRAAREADDRVIALTRTLHRRTEQA